MAEVKPAIQSLVVGFTVQLQSSGKWSNLEQIKHKIQKYFKSKDFLTQIFFRILLTLQRFILETSLIVLGSLRKTQ